jgi:hypothetical protein
MPPSKADVYYDLALEVIPLAESATDLRDWWAAERGHRDEYGLSQQQVDGLIDASKEHITSLGDVARDKPRPRVQPKRQRQTAFI